MRAFIAALWTGARCLIRFMAQRLGNCHKRFTHGGSQIGYTERQLHAASKQYAKNNKMWSVL
jgi:hypothetical protein